MTRSLVFATILTAAVLATPARAAEIDACKYLVVADLARDPYNIAAELRSQGRTRGFLVVDSAAEIPPAESFKACVMIADWLGDTTSGELALQVMDGASGTPVALLRVAALNWWGLERTVRGGVTRLFDQLQYTGFKEEAYKARMDRLYRPRPKLAVTEAEIAARPAQGIEGIWTDPEQQYRLAILPAPEPSTADYVAVVLQVTAPLWEPGEIKAEFSRGDAGQFTSTYYMLNKQPVALTFRLDGNDRLFATLTTSAGTAEVTLLRVTP